MNRGDGNRNRKEQQIDDQPGTPLVRCLVLVAKILNLRETNKTHGGSTGAEQAACSIGARTQGRAAQAGFNFSAVNRRKTGEFTVFGRYRKVVYRCFSVFFVSNFKISKKFINNRQKNRQKL